MYDTGARAARPLKQGGADFMFCPRAQDDPSYATETLIVGLM